jgi:hypothetical protein
MTNSLREWAHGGDRNSSPVEDLVYGGDDLMIVKVTVTRNGVWNKFVGMNRKRDDNA